MPASAVHETLFLDLCAQSKSACLTKYERNSLENYIYKTNEMLYNYISRGNKTGKVMNQFFFFEVNEEKISNWDVTTLPNSAELYNECVYHLFCSKLINFALFTKSTTLSQEDTVLFFYFPSQSSYTIHWHCYIYIPPVYSIKKSSTKISVYTLFQDKTEYLSKVNEAARKTLVISLSSEPKAYTVLYNETEHWSVIKDSFRHKRDFQNTGLFHYRDSNDYILSFYKTCFEVKSKFHSIKTNLKQGNCSITVDNQVKSDDSNLFQKLYSNDQNRVLVTQLNQFYQSSPYAMTRTYILNPTQEQSIILNYLIELRNWICSNLEKLSNYKERHNIVKEKIASDKMEWIQNEGGLHPYFFIPCTVLHLLVAFPLSLDPQKPYLELDLNNITGDHMLHLCYTTKEYSIAICDVVDFKKQITTAKLGRYSDYVFPICLPKKEEENKEFENLLLLLPRDVLEQICFYLTIHDFVSYYCSCKTLYEMIFSEKSNSQQLIWKEFVLHYFFDASVSNSFGYSNQFPLGFASYAYNHPQQPDKVPQFVFDKKSVAKSMQTMEIDWKSYLIQSFKQVNAFQQGRTTRALLCGYGDTGEQEVYQQLAQEYSLQHSGFFCNPYVIGLKNGMVLAAELPRKNIVILHMKKPRIENDLYYGAKMSVLLYALDVTNFEANYKQAYRHFHDVMSQFRSARVRVYVICHNIDDAVKFLPYSSTTIQFDSNKERSVSAIGTVESVLRLHYIGSCRFYMQCSAAAYDMQSFLATFLG